MKNARLTPLLIGAIAVAGFVVRALALSGAGGANGAPAGYDDGVYFSASALLLRGVLPYRDFVFVHPPGVLYFFATTSWLPDPAQAFAAARAIAMLVGGVNVALAGVVAMRIGGPFAGVMAALLYAFYPDAAMAERSAYLEPVLNLFCLLAALVWLRAEKPRPWLAGVLCGVACAVKFWGGIWVIAAMASATNFRRDVPRFIAGASLAGLVLLAIALPAPMSFIEQTLRFQVTRPPDGTLDRMVRLGEIATSGHRAATVLSLIGLVALRRREGRFFAVATLLTVAAFAASSSYWTHYNSHLAASQCVLAGLGAAALLRVHRILAVVPLALLLMLDGDAIRWLFKLGGVRSPEMLSAAHSIRSVVPKDESLFAFDPTLSLAGGQLPPRNPPVVVDSYGAMLLHAVRGGRFPDTAAAFQGSAPQEQIRARLSASRFVLLGWRGGWQMNEADRTWFASHFVCVNPEAGELCVWERLSQPIAGSAALLAQQKVEFGEGWYGEEGLAPKTWRWTAGRAVTMLPAAHAGARLQLELEVPRDTATITIELDGRQLDSFRASGTIGRIYNIADPSSSTPHTLVLTTDRTFVPAKVDPKSADTRELGLRVTKLAWRRSAGGASTSSSR